MKIIVFLFLLMPAACLCQKNDPENLPAAAYELTAEKDGSSSLKLPFASIKVIDSRFDTSKLGFVYSNSYFKGKKSLFKKACLRNGIAQSITDFYNAYYNKNFQDNGFGLLIVMKKFWLSQTNYVKPDNNVLPNFYAYHSVYIKWEYYLYKDDQYLPVKRSDTILAVTNKMTEYLRNDDETAPVALLKLVLKAQVELLDFNKAVSAFDQQPKKSFEWVNNYNNARFNIPILKDRIFKSGIYLDFNEFLNNKPGIVDFTEKKMKYVTGRTAAIYVSDKNGNDIPNYLGYFLKGTFRYGKFEHEPLYNCGNSFQFFHKSIDFSYAPEQFISRDAVGPVYYQRHEDEDWVPYQLDMETGKFY